jgi:hypothetical protein
MLDATWQAMLKRFGAACGVPLGTPSTDCVAREKLLSAYIQENKEFKPKQESKQ